MREQQSKDYILYPKTVVQLANQLKKLTDDYWKNELTLDELNHYILHLNRYKKFFDGENFNTSIRQIVGIKRMKLIKEILKNE